MTGETLERSIAQSEQRLGAEPREVPALRSERLLLRAFRRGDLDAYSAMRADADVQRFLSREPELWDRGRS
jgi:RimJ/RimL family protein N-acetyltransferase